jgi:hypothetical protein
MLTSFDSLIGVTADPPMRRPSAPLFRSALALAAALGATPGHAALDVDASLQALADASVATVVLAPPMAIYQQPLDRAGLQTAGCHYTSDDATAIRALVAILRGGDVTANPVYQRPDVREGVYFAMADGSKFSVLFGDHAGSRLPAIGIAEATSGGQIQSVSVSTKSALATDVRAWAKRYGGIGTGTTCELQSTTAENPQAPPPIPLSR